MGKTRTGRSKQSSTIRKTDGPNDSSGSENIPGRLLDLPLELLGLVFRKYLTTPDRKSLRLVNSEIQVFLDGFVGYDVTLDENDSKPKFKFVSEVTLKSISFYNLTQLKRPKTIKIPTFMEMFSYPQCLREVHVELQLNAGIFNDIVRNCPVLEAFSSSLVSSVGYETTPSSTLKQVILPEVPLHSLEPCEQRYFPKLQSLRMMFKETSDQVQRKLSCEAVLALMKSIRSAFLDCVILQLNMSGAFSIAEATHAAAVCLERNPNVTKFFFGILNQGDASTVEDSSFAEELENKTIELFRKAGKCTRVSRCGIGTEGGYSFRLWKTFFNSCANLIHMSFTLTSQQGPFTREWFNNSKDTLQQFIYRGDFTDPFDFECIQDCVNLREICLHNLRVEDENTQVQADDIRNLHLIPTGVKSLILFQTVCRTDEINGVVNRLPELETLALYKLGHSGESGINIACIRKILGLRKLRSLLLLRFVASSTVEADELVQILQLMGTVTRDDPPFQEIVVVDTDSSDDDDYVPVVNNNFRRLQRNNFNQLRQQFHARLRMVDDDGDETSSDGDWGDDDDDDDDAYSESEASEIVDQQTDDLNAEDANESNTDSAKPETCQEAQVAGDQIDQKNLDSGSVSAEPPVLPARRDGPVDEELLGACGGVGPPLDLSPVNQPTGLPVARSSLPVVTALEVETPIRSTDSSQDLRTSKDVGNLQDLQPAIPLEPVLKPVEQLIPLGDVEPIEIDPLIPAEPVDELIRHERAIEAEVDDAVAALDQFIDENRDNFQIMVNLHNEEELRDILDVLQPVQADDNNILFGFILEAVIDISDDDSSIPNEYGRWKPTMNPETGDLTYELKLNCFIG